MIDDIEAYSDTTGKRYPNWDALVEAEANGYVVLGTSERKNTAAIVIGPYSTRAEATLAQARLRKKWARDEAPHKITTSVRILWKENRK